MKLELSEKQAISECKKLWNEIEASGLSKFDFLASPEGKVWKDKNYRADCPLCGYARSFNSTQCSPCPLIQKYGRGCFALGYRISLLANKEWLEAIRGL